MSIRQVVNNGRDDPYIFDVRVVVIPRGNTELPLRGGLYLAEAAVGILCELLGHLAGFPGRSLDHLRLDIVESCKQILRPVHILITRYCDSLLSEIYHIVHDTPHRFDSRRIDGDGLCGHIPERLVTLPVNLGRTVGDDGSCFGDLFIIHTIGFEKTDNLTPTILELLIDLFQIVAGLGKTDRPDDNISQVLLFSESTHGYRTLILLE